MTEEFTITAHYKGDDLQFTARLLLQGYSHQFEVDINGVLVHFEPDDSGSYRVLKMPWQEEKELLKIDKTLLAAISGSIEAILA